jgi:hypothetical protein
MYTRLGAVRLQAPPGSRSTTVPFVNIAGKTPFATLRNPHHGKLQDRLSGLGATGATLANYTQGLNPANASQASWIASISAGLDAAAAMGAPGWINTGAFPVPQGFTTWTAAPEISGKPGSFDSQNQVIWLAPRGSVNNAPSGGILYTYAQALASQGVSAQRGGVVSGFAQTNLTAFGQPLYAVSAAATAPASAPVTTAAQTPTAPSAGIVMDTPMTPVTVVQGPIQSSGGIASTVAMLPQPSVPGMDMSATDQSNAVAAAINGQNVTGVSPVPDQGPSTLTLIAIGVVAFLLLRR